jgi:hypothetical protein
MGKSDIMHGICVA